MRANVTNTRSGIYILHLGPTVRSFRLLNGVSDRYRQVTPAKASIRLTRGRGAPNKHGSSPCLDIDSAIIRRACISFPISICIVFWAVSMSLRHSSPVYITVPSPILIVHECPTKTKNNQPEGKIIIHKRTLFVLFSLLLCYHSVKNMTSCLLWPSAKVLQVQRNVDIERQNLMR